MTKNSTKKLGLLLSPETVDEMNIPQQFKDVMSWRYWLKSAVGEDATAMAHQIRMQQAEHFLLTVLHPLADSRTTIDEDKIVQLLLQYLKSAPFMGNELKISHVLGTILNRLDCYSIENLGTEHASSDVLWKDLNLLEILGNLDIKAVDMRVAEQMYRL